MHKVIVVGSGPAAVGAALALTRRSDVEIDVIDIGVQLDANHREALDVLSTQSPEQWSEGELSLIAGLPEPSAVRGLPVKRSYGSDYPFRDAGQLEGVHTRREVNDKLVSGAYGGFSNVWGAQIMPFTTPTFDRWPISRDVMVPHYQSILAEIPFAAEEDDLADRFPLLTPSSPLPPQSERTGRVLGSYQRHRDRLNAMGITMGKARLALEASKCVLCRHCMTGWPY